MQEFSVTTLVGSAHMWRGHVPVKCTCAYDDLVAAGPPWVPRPDGKGGRLFRVMSPSVGVKDYPRSPKNEVGEWEHRFLSHGVEMFVEGGEVYNEVAIRYLGLRGEDADCLEEWRKVGFDVVETGLLRGDVVLIHR